ncbi:hypothetical protein PR048_017615 [Dryococelus australis]|uniref:Uncharacterized protein n=1 Tax=Dryococelus australis TaxID=614101 RepID=A0ABQ9HA03_9NEOP|nr:hypothetical protein PR048_017615 [Dryococelus australis]
MDRFTVPRVVWMVTTPVSPSNPGWACHRPVPDNILPERAAIKPAPQQTPSPPRSLRLFSVRFCEGDVEFTADMPPIPVPILGLFVSLEGGGGRRKHEYSPPTQGEPGSITGRFTPSFFASGNLAGQCRWLAGFLGDLPVSPALSLRRCFILNSITLNGSQDLDIKSHPDLFTHSFPWSRGGVVHKLRCRFTPCTTLAHAHGLAVILLSSHLGERASIPGGVAPGFSHVGILPDAAGFFGALPVSPTLAFQHYSILTSLHPDWLLKTSILRATQICPRQPTPSFPCTLIWQTSQHVRTRAFHRVAFVVSKPGAYLADNNLKLLKAYFIFLYVPHPERWLSGKSWTCFQEEPGSITGLAILIFVLPLRRNTARLARRNDEALGVRVSVARIAPSLLDLGRGVPTGVEPTLKGKDKQWLVGVFRRQVAAVSRASRHSTNAAAVGRSVGIARFRTIRPRPTPYAIEPRSLFVWLAALAAPTRLLCCAREATWRPSGGRHLRRLCHDRRGVVAFLGHSAAGTAITCTDDTLRQKNAGCVRIRQLRALKGCSRDEAADLGQGTDKDVFRASSGRKDPFAYRMKRITAKPRGFVVLEVAAIDLEAGVQTTPKVVKGTGEDMLRDGIGTGPLLKDSSCISQGSSYFLYCLYHGARPITPIRIGNHARRHASRQKGIGQPWPAIGAMTTFLSVLTAKLSLEETGKNRHRRRKKPVDRI